VYVYSLTYGQPRDLLCLPPSTQARSSPPPSGTTKKSLAHTNVTRRLRRSRPPKVARVGREPTIARVYGGQKNGVWLWRTIQTFNECGWQPPCTLAARLVSPRCHHHLRTIPACSCRLAVCSIATPPPPPTAIDIGHHVFLSLYRYYSLPAAANRCRRKSSSRPAASSGAADCFFHRRQEARRILLDVHRGAARY